MVPIFRASCNQEYGIRTLFKHEYIKHDYQGLDYRLYYVYVFIWML